MRPTRIVFAFATMGPLALLLGSCAHEKTALRACAMPRHSVPGLSFSGTSEQHGADGRSEAFLDAVKTGLAPLVGLSVTSVFIDQRMQREHNGNVETTSRTSDDSRVSFGFESLRDYSATFCESPEGLWRADIFVPQGEVERLKRNARGVTKVYVSCVSEAAGACSPDLDERVRSIARAASLEVSDVAALGADAKVAEVASDARKSGAARALVVKLSARAGRSDDTYTVCRAQSSATLYASDDEKGLAEAKPAGFGGDGGYKGTVFRNTGTLREACSLAFREALKELEGAMTAHDSPWAKLRKN